MIASIAPIRKSPCRIATGAIFTLRLGYRLVTVANNSLSEPWSSGSGCGQSCQLVIEGVFQRCGAVIALDDCKHDLSQGLRRDLLVDRGESLLVGSRGQPIRIIRGAGALGKHRGNTHYQAADTKGGRCCSGITHSQQTLCCDGFRGGEDSTTRAATSSAPYTCSFFVWTRVGNFGVGTMTFDAKHVYMLSYGNKKC